MVEWKPKHNLIYLVVLVFIGLNSCKSTSEVEPDKSPILVDFVAADNLAYIVDKAAEEGKLVFVEFVTDWCLPCKMMDEDVFTHKETADFLNEHFISYKIDAEKENGPDMKFLYEVKSIPTLLFMDTKGRVLVRKEGAAYHSELTALAKQALSN